jgi:AcrR family transcriptional regulator
VYAGTDPLTRRAHRLKSTVKTEQQARIELGGRIAKVAGCNKNLIYVYFENKETLFTTVLQKHLLRVYQELEFSPDDLPGYATRVFDFAMAHPDLMRLMAWANLEHDAHNPAERAAAHAAKVAELKTAQDTGQDRTVLPPSFLLTAIMTLATTWTAANPFGLPVDPDAAKHPAELRENIAEAVKILADPQQPGGRQTAPPHDAPMVDSERQARLVLLRFMRRRRRTNL